MKGGNLCKIFVTCYNCKHKVRYFVKCNLILSLTFLRSPFDGDKVCRRGRIQQVLSTGVNNRKKGFAVFQTGLLSRAALKCR